MIRDRQRYESLDSIRKSVDSIIVTRRKRGMTQKELSRRSGVPQDDLSRIERGKLIPGTSTLIALARGLDAGVPETAARRSPEANPCGHGNT